jgi:hypothetical protein
MLGEKKTRSGERNEEAAFPSFIGGIFEGWEGLLSVNGTIEGFIKLGSA